MKCYEHGEQGRHAVTKQKLQYFGHVVRRDGVNLEKVVMFGKVEGKEVDVRGGQRLMWTDRIHVL